MSDEKIIFSMTGVNKIYPPQKQVLKNIYLSFFYGAKIGVLGLNGSGKSSLLRIIAGIDKEYQGEVVSDLGYSVGLLEQEPEASFGGQSLELTPREYDLLVFFAHHPGRVLSREELLRKVWGYDYVGETRTVDVHVRRLRVKLGEGNRVIETVTGAGYKLAARRRVPAR